jgi:tetratricopeptide (TPR) repeat protein
MGQRGFGRFLAGAVRKLHLWLQTRSWRLLVPGLPAIMVGAGIVAAFLGGLWRQTPEQLRSRYLQRGQTYLAEGSFAKALVCYERLIRLAPEQEEVVYGLALAAEGVGQAERAVHLMSQLAPQDQAGYAPAHLWFAKRLLQAPQPTDRILDAAEKHLLHALDGELDKRAEAEGILGELYLIRRRLDLAETYLSRAVKADPRLHLRLAQVFALKGHRDQARWAGEQALSFYRAWTRSEPTSSLARLGWAEALLFLESYEQAVQVLEEGLRLGEEGIYRPALVRAYLVWSEAATRSTSGGGLSRQLSLLEKALEVDPHHPDLIMQLWALTRTQGPAADKAREALRQRLVSGQANGLVHLALGMDAWERGRPQEALVHLEQAYQLAPHLGLVANNLAWVLASMEPPDLDRALQLVDTVLARWPDDPLCRDTRGFILSRKGKHREALAEYQKALPRMANDPGIHQRLAEVYDRLGMADLAAEHRRKAQQLSEASRSSAPSP